MRLPWIRCTKCGIAIDLPDDERAPGNDAILVRHMNALAAAHEKNCLGTGFVPPEIKKEKVPLKARKAKLDQTERELQEVQEQLNKEALKLVRRMVESFLKGKR